MDWSSMITLEVLGRVAAWRLAQPASMAKHNAASKSVRFMPVIFCWCKVAPQCRRLKTKGDESAI